jgi:hypothetical protein
MRMGHLKVGSIFLCDLFDEQMFTKYFSHKIVWLQYVNLVEFEISATWAPGLSHLEWGW